MVTLIKVAVNNRTLEVEASSTKEASLVMEETNNRALVEEDSDRTLEIPPDSP